MYSKSTKKSGCSRRQTPVQVAIVIMFFISVFANIGILLTTHAKDKIPDDYDYDMPPEQREARDTPGKTMDLSELGAAITGNQSASKQDFIKAMVACIREKMQKKGKSDDQTGEMSKVVLPSYDNMFLQPSAIDSDVLSSMNWTLDRELQQQVSVFKFLSEPAIRKHDFPYIHNPKEECARRKIDLVLAVSSAPENFEFRMKTREGLKGSYAHERSNNATLLFFIGRSNHHNKSKRFQVEINMEMRRFGDIVQEDFVDSYRNLTLKTISVLKWVSTFCTRTAYVIKSDDDVGIKVAYAVAALQRYQKRFGNFLLGRWNTMNIVMRNKQAKNYVSVEEYPHPTFPPHVLGGAMGFPVSTAKLLFQASLRIPPAGLEDVYISGVCAPRVGVPVFMDADFDFKHKQWT
ncbi:unnamed protein product [Lymnaea stagnalis]|uniref:Hexosyltransferase n=1 Tax=Lymnaea stagnalis TaxID=6523 RepID=A0AAV2HKJ0_LYMST